MKETTPMTDYSPLTAFCEARIAQLDREINRNPDDLTVCLPKARKNELEAIVSLCRGLNHQEKLLEQALGLKCHVSDVV